MLTAGRSIKWVQDILPKEQEILYLNDSKKLSEKKREALYDEIMEKTNAKDLQVAAGKLKFTIEYEINDGIYPTMAQEFAKAFATDGIKLINREEDCGDAGLRISKMQYHPIDVKEKNFVRVKTLFDKISEEYENKKPYYKSVVLASCLEIRFSRTSSCSFTKSVTASIFSIFASTVNSFTVHPPVRCISEQAL